MPIIRCPSCRKRYDAGVDEELDDLPEGLSIKVVCPACGQWLRLPEREAIPAPNAPPEMLRQMRAQSRLVDDEPPRRASRPRREEDDEDEDRPRRRTKPAKKSNKGLVIGLAVGGAVLLLGCCGVGGVLAYVYGPGTGYLTITQAAREPGRLGGTHQVRIDYRVTGSSPAGTQLVAVASADGATSRSMPMPGAMGNGTGHVSWTTAELESASGPVEVWIEERPTGGGPGKRVSNTYKIR